MLGYTLKYCMPSGHKKFLGTALCCATERISSLVFHCIKCVDVLYGHR